MSNILSIDYCADCAYAADGEHGYSVRWEVQEKFQDLYQMGKMEPDKILVSRETIGVMQAMGEPEFVIGDIVQCAVCKEYFLVIACVNNYIALSCEYKLKRIKAEETIKTISAIEEKIFWHEEAENIVI